MSLFLGVCMLLLFIGGGGAGQEGSNDSGGQKQTQCQHRKVTYSVSKKSGEAFDSQPFSHLPPFNLDYKQHKQTVTALAPLSKNTQGEK